MFLRGQRSHAPHHPTRTLSLFRSVSLSPGASPPFGRYTGKRVMRRRLTDGGDEGGVESVLAEPEQQAGLADAAVPDEQQLEQVVVRLRHFPAVRPSVRPCVPVSSRGTCGLLPLCWADWLHWERWFRAGSTLRAATSSRKRSGCKLAGIYPAHIRSLFFHNKASLSQRAPLLMIVSNYNISHV